MSPAPPAAPRVFALLGDPVAHSLSPRLQNAAFAAAGVDATYRTIRVAPGELVRQLRALAEAGGGGNITAPYKQLAVQALDTAAEAVSRTGAVNTFWRGPGGVQGDNTDVAGFRDALVHHAIDLAGRPVLLLGAGGAAAAVLAALLEAGSEVTIVNRSPERSQRLLAQLSAVNRVRQAASPPAEPFSAVINATSLGMQLADPLPLAIGRLPERAVVLDLVYTPGTTAWVRAARAAGHAAFDGTEMLLHQAAAAFSLWMGRPAPLEVMRAALADR